MPKQWLSKFFICLLYAVPALGYGAAVQSDHIDVELVSEVTSIQPGEPFWVGVRLLPEEHWKTYWRNPGGSGLPTQIEWHLPEALSAGEVQWPYPEQFEFQGVMSYGYETEAMLLTRLQPAETLKTDTVLPIKATVSWLVCYHVCIPGSADLTLELPVKSSSPEPDSRWAPVFAAARDRLPVQAEGWQALFAMEDDRLVLEVKADEPVFTDAEEVLFFPYRSNLISNTVLQERDWGPLRFFVRHQTSDRFSKTPDKVDGVVVVKNGTKTVAYVVSAMPDAALQFSPVGEQAAVPASTPVGGNLFQVMIFAMLGGLLLNLMPCVFPVLSLKAIGLLEAVHISHAAQRLHGIAYTLGVMVFFCAVAGLLYLLKASGAGIGWGFQLQTPWFVALLAYVLFILGLSFSGLLEFGSRFMGVGESLVHRGGYTGSFFTGALAAVVASPCTAPFMGTAIAFAMAQPAFYSLLVFMSLGLGMALPFLLVSFVPQVGHVLPKPGPWMNTFKQFMAFPLYITAVWLLWVLARQTDATAVAAVLMGMVLLVFAVWLRHLQPRPKGRWRYANGLLAVVATVAAFGVLTTPLLEARPPNADASTSVAKEGFWQPYSADRLAELRAQGRAVFLNLTADWCISCIANDRVALSMPSVRRVFKEKNIVPLKGDWTNYNPEITRILETFGRNGVPLYVLYPPEKDAEPQMLPQWLSPTTVIDALESI